MYVYKIYILKEIYIHMYVHIVVTGGYVKAPIKNPLNQS